MEAGRIEQMKENILMVRDPDHEHLMASLACNISEQ
jgi:hypothetical protein